MEISTQFLVLVPVILGVVEVLKMTGLPPRLAPLVSLGLGVFGAYFFVAHDMQSILQGIIAGLSASGLWSGVKNTLK